MSVQRAGDDQQVIDEREAHGTADAPAYEFNSAITVGMSPPPMGRMNRTPKQQRKTRKVGNTQVGAGRDHPDAEATRRRERAPG